MRNLSTLRKFNISRHAKFPKLGESPETDWKIICISSAVIATLVIALCVGRFLSINGHDVYSTEDPGQQELTFNLEALKRAGNYYSEKAQKFDLIEGTSTSAIVDPSL